MRSRGPLSLFAVLLTASAARAELVDRIVAIIDRDVVTLSEAEQAGAVARARTGEDEALATIVEKLIESRLVEREVERLSGEPPPSDAVDTAFEEVRRAFASEESFRQTLGASGLSEDDLRAQLRRHVQVASYLEQRFRPLTFVTEEQVEVYYRDELAPSVRGRALPAREDVSESIHRILEERAFNARVSEWIESLKGRARIRRYVW